MLSLYWLGMYVGTMEWIILWNLLIIVLLKNQWPLTKTDEKVLTRRSEPIYYDCVLIQLQELGYCLIYSNTLFKAQTKPPPSYWRTFATGALFVWNVFLPWIIPTQPSDSHQTSSYLQPLISTLVAHWLTWGAVSQLDAQVLPRDSHVIGIGVYLGYVWTLRFFKAQMIMKCSQGLRTSVDSILCSPLPGWP